VEQTLFKCKTCGLAKRRDEFHRAGNEWRKHCKTCRKQHTRKYRVENSESINERQRQHYALNAESINEQRRQRNVADPGPNRARALAWQTANPERAQKRKQSWASQNANRISERRSQDYAANPGPSKERSAKYRAANPESSRNITKQWAAANPERVRVNRRKWSARNPDKIRAKDQRRRAKENGAEGSHTVAEWRGLVNRFGGRCVCCKEHFGLKGLTEDHVIPLSRGGSDLIENIQPLCGPCNSRKKDRSTDYRDSFGAAGGGANAA
jgi:5-methylcytosine-specific restriction endonuclease McrA